MDCNEFLERYSDFRDGADLGPEPEAGGAQAFEAHLEACPTCRRYHEVIEQGTNLLRDLGPLPLQDDFRDRLQHRIYSADLSQRRPRDLGTATPLMIGLAAAGVVAVVAAWGPMLEAVAPVPTASLPAISAAVPEAVLLRPAVSGGANRAPAALVQPDFWAQSHQLLYEHSPLNQRNRDGGIVRAGVQ